jgi:hypothetical protein
MTVVCLQQLGLYKTFTCFPFNFGYETENQNSVAKVEYRNDKTKLNPNAIK